MRAWLHDPRAYYVLKHWLRSPFCQKLPGYNLVENFRPFVSRATNRFFVVEGLWRDSDVWLCCAALGVSPPPSLDYLMDSYSEDELICRTR